MEATKLNNKSTKLDDVKKVDTPQASVKLTDDSIKEQETINEIKKDKANKKALVRYIGNGVWIDTNGEHWADHHIDNTFIESERQYDLEVYETRKDIKFMIDYGQMTVSFI